jgi:ABC-type cobalamin transport system permease subunit
MHLHALPCSLGVCQVLLQLLLTAVVLCVSRSARHTHSDLLAAVAVVIAVYCSVCVCVCVTL